MPAEKIKNPDTRENILETLAKKHDQLLEEAAEHEEAIILLREKLKTNREKEYVFTDKAREKEITQEYDDIRQALSWRKAELRKIWDKIHEIQAEQIRLEVKKE